MTTLTKKLIACVCAAAAAAMAALPSYAEESVSDGIALYDIKSSFGDPTEPPGGSRDYEHSFEKVDKTNYYDGEGFDPTGLTIKESYDPGEYEKGWHITYDTAKGTNFTFKKISSGGTKTDLNPGDELNIGDKVEVIYRYINGYDYRNSGQPLYDYYTFPLPISIKDKTEPTTEPTTEPATEPTYIPSYIPSPSPSPAENEPKFGDKSGWDSISDEINNNTDGKINVDMNGTTNVPKDILSDISGKDIDLVLDMGDGMIWTINGKDVTDPKDIDFGIKKVDDVIPVEVMNNVTGQKETIQLTLSYDGDFGLAAKLTVSLGSSNNGYYANLFYYNTEKKALELVDFSKIEDGKSELVFTHASDWAIVIDREPLGADTSTEAGVIAEENNVVGQSGVSMFVFPAIAAAVLGAFAAFFRIKAKGKSAK